MSKRRQQDSDFVFGTEDDPIGLTSAFAPVKGPQSVDYDEGDDAIGLTQAFEPIPDQDEPREWDETGKWKNFDWDAFESVGEGSGAEEPEGFTEGDDGGNARLADAVDGIEGNAGSTAAAATAVSAKPSSASSPKSGRGRHAAPDPMQSSRMQKSRKTRRKLAVVVVLLIVVIAALAVFMFHTFSSSQEEATHQAQEQVAEPKDELGGELANDASDSTVKLTEVPNLSKVFGMTTDEAIDWIGHGAIVTSNREVDEKDSDIKSNVSVALTEEPYDSKTGSPTVYLGLDEDGYVLQVGYSASAGALGFGELSFQDAVNNEHVIEATLAKIGVSVPMGSATLPEDKSEYSTYNSDGKTVVRERCSFEGDTELDGVPCTWSSVLSYDYTTQIVTGDLSDTVRIIYVYITQK